MRRCSRVRAVLGILGICIFSGRRLAGRIVVVDRLSFVKVIEHCRDFLDSQASFVPQRGVLYRLLADDTVPCPDMTGPCKLGTARVQSLLSILAKDSAKRRVRELPENSRESSHLSSVPSLVSLLHPRQTRWTRSHVERLEVQVLRGALSQPTSLLRCSFPESSLPPTLLRLLLPSSGISFRPMA